MDSAYKMEIDQRITYTQIKITIKRKDKNYVEFNYKPAEKERSLVCV